MENRRLTERDLIEAYTPDLSSVNRILSEFLCVAFGNNKTECDFRRNIWEDFLSSIVLRFIAKEGIKRRALKVLSEFMSGK